MKLIPVVKVSRELIESLLKSRAGLVQRQTWVKDGSGRKGHYRMQWVSPGNGQGAASDTSKQIDLFAESEKKKEKTIGSKIKRETDMYGYPIDPAKEYVVDHVNGWGDPEYVSVEAWDNSHPREKPEKQGDGAFDYLFSDNSKYKPKYPDKGEFAGNGLGDNGREYEGYRAKDGSTHFYDTETGREIGEDGEYLNEKKPDPKVEGKPLIDQIKVTKISKRRIEFEYQGETYALGARGDNAIALKTIQKDGKAWYNYGGKLGVTGEVSYGEKLKLEESLRKKYGKYDREKQMYEFSDPSKGEKAKDNAGEYKIYHDTFTGVIDEVVNHLGKQGLYMSEDDVFHKIATGPGRPKGGRTDRYTIPLFTGEGKPAGKAVSFQVYDMDGKKFELNMYVSPMKKTLYQDDYEDTVQVRKPAGEEDFNVLGGYNKNVVSAESKEGADIVASAVVKMASGGANKKKPFEDMTFEAKKTTGRPENVAETVRDVLSMSSGSVAQFAGSARYEDIDKFRDAAAKWAYENDKIGTGFDILAEYRVHGKAKEAPSVGADIDSVSMRDMWEVLDPGPYSDNIAAYEDAAKKIKESAAAWAKTNKKTGEGMALIKEYMASKGMKKSIVGSFRAGLAKAFGGR